MPAKIVAAFYHIARKCQLLLFTLQLSYAGAGRAYYQPALECSIFLGKISFVIQFRKKAMPPTPIQPISSSAAWQALKQAANAARRLNIRQLLDEDDARVRDFSIDAAGLRLDYSRHLLHREQRDLLISLAQQSRLAEAIEAMFTGQIINNTEQRPALHVALRSPHADSPEEKSVQATLATMESFVQAVHQGSWHGAHGQAIRDVVNIGIGGSDLGPAMSYAALEPFHHGAVRCHFVSNIDPCHLQQTLAGLDAGSTLFVIASKTFTTLETLQNAEAARRWVLSRGIEESALGQHFVAVTSNIEKARQFGILPDNILPMWDWVGGRYSLWSAIGLPLALGIGMDHFRALLAGAHTMDKHFRQMPIEQNMPVMMALLQLWYSQFLGANSQVVLPYIQNLHLFPNFLQQLEMESLGKSVRHDGTSLDIASGGILWGSAGTNGQHSFHQLLHQGSHLIPADFIATARSPVDQSQHEHLLANCFAQSQALMDGKSLQQAQQELLDSGMSETEAGRLAPHKVIPGNRPSSTILMQALTPETLGALIAAYEHKVYATSVILQINAFDQWGVELGKVLSKEIYQALSAEKECKNIDTSTRQLINYCIDAAGN